MTLSNQDKVVDWITREEFEEMVEAFIRRKTSKFQAKALITKATVQDVLLVLKEKNSQVRTPSFRFWARKRFVSRKEQRGNWVLCAREDHDVVGKPVCPREELFDVITEAHINSNHRGRDPTYDWVKKSRSYVPKELCDILVKKCTQCASKRKTKESTDTQVEKPIATTRFMTMLKMTLIEHRLGSEAPFILHLKDVYSNFHWAYAVDTIHVQSVIPALHRLFCQFGTPSILSYNCQFTQDMINALTRHWPTLRLIHSQIGIYHCTEEDSAFALQLSQWFQGKQHVNHTVWPDCLFDFCCHLNTTTHPETGKIPHDIVFGKMPPQDDIQHIWGSILSKVRTSYQINQTTSL
ncbi:uncharacterized protein ATC70_000365 [Mucor velutinosus]|uniref:Integrase zinc-binding domain-containing protein n=1 Tax=Mucor velutinosus TaxID=708070 RepID=A0AAN7DGG3_9FUNG|nr:hypothetical protein ATC70_000365 [Mucor velutinosus]